MGRKQELIKDFKNNTETLKNGFMENIKNRKQAVFSIEKSGKITILYSNENQSLKIYGLIGYYPFLIREYPFKNLNKDLKESIKTISYLWK
ncbi:MAG: hypothetical protein ACOC1P_02810 [Minisyncoccales bacterium]